MLLKLFKIICVIYFDNKYCTQIKASKFRKFQNYNIMNLVQIIR